MIINSQQLINNIKKPNNLYLLFGFEELLIQQSNDEILKNLKEQNYENRFIFDIDARSNFDNLKNELTSHNLFITKKIIQINIASTNAKITKELKKIIVDIKENVVIIVLMKKLTLAQQKSKWFECFKENGLVVQHFEISALNMPNWVQLQMQKESLLANKEVANIIALNNEGNLLNANNEIKKLKLVYGNNQIDTNKFIQQLEQQSIYTVYSLIDNSLTGNTKQMYKIYKQIEVDNNYLISLLYIQIKQLIDIHIKIKQNTSLTMALNQAGVWSSKINMITKVIRRCSYPQLQKILLTLGRVERSNKGRDNININQNLLNILLTLSGVQNGIN